MLLNRTPVGAYGLAGGVEAAGSVLVSASGQADATSTFDVAAEPANGSAQCSGDASREAFAIVSVSLLSTATGLVEGSSAALGQGTPILARAIVRGTWQNVGYGDAAGNTSVQNITEAERIVTPPALTATGDASIITATDPTGQRPAAAELSATAEVYADAAVLKNADGVLYVDASSHLVISTAAVVSSVAYDYALNTSACFCEATGDAELITHGTGDCQTNAVGMSGVPQQGFAITAVADVQSSATAISSSADRAAYASADLTPGILVQNTTVDIGVVASAKAWALVSLGGDKIRDTYANANVSIAVAEAEAFKSVSATGSSTGPGNSGGTGVVNDLFLAPEERTIYVGYDDRNITVGYESRLLEVA